MILAVVLFLDLLLLRREHHKADVDVVKTKDPHLSMSTQNTIPSTARAKCGIGYTMLLVPVSNVSEVGSWGLGFLYAQNCMKFLMFAKTIHKWTSVLKVIFCDPF